LRSALLIVVFIVWVLAGVGCQKQPSVSEGASGGNHNVSAPMGSVSAPMGRRRPAPERIWTPDATKRCPSALPGARVELEDVPGGVRMVVRGDNTAAHKTILAHARYLEDASRRAKRPERALTPAAHQTCPVVLTGTRVVVTPLARGAALVITAQGAQTATKLRGLARQRLARAFPLPKVSQWKCGAFTGMPTQKLQAHQARGIFAASPHERLVPTGWDAGSTTISNEARLELFQKVATDRGGGYVGVGSTQNFMLAAWANAEWVWLMDFTRIVVDANKAHIAFLEVSPTAKEFVALWQPARKADGLRILRRRYAKDPGLSKIEHAYSTAAKFVSKRFGQVVDWAKQRRYDTWLTDAKLYGRIRRLALRGRIRALQGDLNGSSTLCGIGEAAKRMGVVIRIWYPSNAEEYKVFRPYKWTFRRNVRNLPADDRSLVLRTYTFSPSRLIWPKGWKGVSKVGFHYNAQPLRGFQHLLKLANLDIKKVMTRAQDPDRDGFSLSKQ
jgi:hypothetical protein